MTRLISQCFLLFPISNLSFRPHLSIETPFQTRLYSFTEFHRQRNAAGLVKYDPKVITAYYSKRPLTVWERLVEIGSPILGWWILRKFDEISSLFRTTEENQEILNLRASDLKDAIVQGKSIALIKSGQALSLRPDIVKSAE
jgi:hypothetical protein